MSQTPTAIVSTLLQTPGPARDWARQNGREILNDCQTARPASMVRKAQEVEKATRCVERVIKSMAVSPAGNCNTLGSALLKAVVEQVNWTEIAESIIVGAVAEKSTGENFFIFDNESRQLRVGDFTFVESQGVWIKVKEIVCYVNRSDVHGTIVDTVGELTKGALRTNGERCKATKRVWVNV